MKFNEIHLSLIELCPLNCRHCYEGKSKKFLSRNEWIKIIEIIYNNWKPKNIILLGGEPLMHPDLYAIMAFAISRCKTCSVQTSGVLSSDFQNYKCEVAVSFESCFKDKNDEIRKFANSNASVYDLAVKKLLAGKKYDNPTQSRITLYNDSDVLASIVFAEKLGSNLTLVPLMRQGCAENLIHRIPNAQKIREAMEICMEANERMKGHHEIQIPQWYLANLDLFNKYKGLFLKNHRICPAGQNRLFIDSKSNVKSCMFMPKPCFGNLLKDKISVIEKNINEFNEKIKNIEPQGKCKGCDAWNYCHGGCVSKYFSTKKSHMGEDCPMILE